MPDDAPGPSEEELDKKLRHLLGDDAAPVEDVEDPLDKKARELELRADNLKLPPVPSFEDEFGERIKALEQKAHKAKSVQQAKQETVRKAEATGTATGLSLQQGLTLAYTIIGLPLLGVGIGYGIDAATGGTHAKEIGMLIGSVVGIWMAFVLVNRANKKG